VTNKNLLIEKVLNDVPTLAYQFNPKNAKPKIFNPMRKFIYAVALTLLTSLAFTACTEEEVKPSQNAHGGGGPTDPL
jgi:hypothetical protein